MSVPILGSRHKGSFPLFWVFGSLFSLGALFVGGYSVYSCLSIDPSERDNGQFAFGIAALIAVLLMLAGVIFTLRLMSDPDNMSLVVDVNAAQGKKKYNSLKLTRYIERAHNNVLLFNASEGQMRVFGSKDNFIVEVVISESDGFSTYHLTNPSETSVEPVITGNIFFERFPVRKNRIVSKEKAIRAIETLYESKSLNTTVSTLPFTDSTEETTRLIDNEAYITPAVPLVFHKKQKDIERNLKEKEEREKRAMQVLRTY